MKIPKKINMKILWLQGKCSSSIFTNSSTHLCELYASENCQEKNQNFPRLNLFPFYLTKAHFIRSRVGQPARGFM